MRVVSPRPTGSILITSAPMSARNMAHEGPARCCVESMTRSPVRAPVMVGLLCMRDKELRNLTQVLYDSAVRRNKRCYDRAMKGETDYATCAIRHLCCAVCPAQYE